MKTVCRAKPCWKVDWIPEDWDSITSLVRGSDMMLKDATLDLIDNVEISKGRERMLMSLADGKPYRYLSEKIFPAVMRVDYRIEYTCKPLGAAESLQLLRSGKQRALRLNEDLTEAISLAHDLGHTPFGHAGERALNQLCPGGFKHYVQSLRVVDKLEKEGRGLNLSWEVRNGIVTHTKGTWAATPEGRIVRMADQIAYVNHDIEDAVRAGVLDPDILPKDCTAVLGTTKSARITTMINSILRNSDGNVRVGTEENEAFLALRDFMYATVYVDKTAKREEQKVDKVIGELYDYYLNHIDRMSNFYVQLAYQEGRDRAVTDYISGMSDEFAIRTFEELFVPQKWHVL